MWGGQGHLDYVQKPSRAMCVCVHGCVCMCMCVYALPVDAWRHPVGLQGWLAAVAKHGGHMA